MKPPFGGVHKCHKTRRRLHRRMAFALPLRQRKPPRGWAVGRSKSCHSLCRHWPDLDVMCTVSMSAGGEEPDKSRTRRLNMSCGSSPCPLPARGRDCAVHPLARHRHAAGVARRRSQRLAGRSHGRYLRHALAPSCGRYCLHRVGRGAPDRGDCRRAEPPDETHHAAGQEGFQGRDETSLPRRVFHPAPNWAI